MTLYFGCSGAIGAALLAKVKIKIKGKTSFRGLEIIDILHEIRGFDCEDCSNMCEIIEKFV